MKRPTLLLYGFACYVLFNISFLYMAGFLSEKLVPKAINDGEIISLPTAIAINSFLIFLFGFFHSLMARKRFKDWWVGIVSKDAERSTYVLQASLFLSLVMWQWQPMPQTLWQVQGAFALAVYGIMAIGILVVLISTFLIDHFELFGLSYVWSASRSKPAPDPTFQTPLFYKLVRHPMQLGVVITVFATPHMTLGHLLFASAMTLYIVIGLHFEERSLVREFGDEYRAYQRRVPMLFPIPKIRRVKSGAAL